jgi:acyl-CoA synthetase (AMP-forming)/AMP-acid ligase II
VGVLLRNCGEVMEAHYAAAAVHAVVVNLNVSLAAAELLYILRASGARMLLCGAEFAPAVRAVFTLAAEQGLAHELAVDHIVWVGALPGGGGGGPPPQPPGVAGGWRYEADCLPAFGGPGQASALAAAEAEVARHRALQARLRGPSGCCLEDGYQLYYTSGTTGSPKPALLSHRVVVLHALGTIRGGRGGGGGGCPACPHAPFAGPLQVAAARTPHMHPTCTPPHTHPTMRAPPRRDGPERRRRVGPLRAPVPPGGRLCGVRRHAGGRPPRAAARLLRTGRAAGHR